MISMVLWRRCACVLILAVLADSARAEPSEVSVVPRPVAVKSSSGFFRLNAHTRIVALDPESHRVATQFNELLRARTGLTLKIGREAPRTGNFIAVGSPRREPLPTEGYRLIVRPQDIRLGGHGAGLYYGMQTLIQLVPADQQPIMELPALDITDYPRFGHRGLLIDVARHYFPVSYLKKLIDLAAQYKINRFQWHLTDNEGWRLQISKYPRLTEPPPAAPGEQPVARSYYTQREVRDFLRYAKARFVTVIPEIEMPAHAGAVVAAYPRLGCPGGDDQVLCPTNATFKFVEDVLGEVAALFPSPYIHVGGDEVDKQGWQSSPTAQAIMKQHHLADEEQLQSYFIKRVGKILARRGKGMIGWDEIMEGGLAPNAVVMSWRGEGGGIEAAEQDHPVIMAPTDYTYFDYNQGDPTREPAAIGGFLPLARAYGYDPLPKELPENKRRWVLGAQANVWTEYIASPDYLEYMLFPRLLAFSEAVWSPATGRDYSNFRHRLPAQLHHLDVSGVHYRLPEPDGLKDVYTTTEDHVNVELKSLVPGSTMYYTLDGSEPTEGSASYQKPFNVALKASEKVVLKLIVAAPDHRRSVVYDASFLNRPYVNALDVASPQPGLNYLVVDASLDSARNLSARTPAQQGVTKSLDLKQFKRSTDYGVSFDGLLLVPLDSYYQFAVESDDGSVLTIDDETVVDNDGRHAARTVTGHIPLRKGLHKLRLDYFQAGEASTLKVRWAPADGKLRLLSGAALAH